MARYRHGGGSGRPHGVDGTLAALRPGQAGVIHTIEGGLGLARRLAALGMVPGTPVSVLSNSAFGPMIVEVRGSRLALGRREAMRIMVEPKAG